MHPLVLFLYGVWTIAVYILPTAITFSRKKKDRWIIAVINILGGWIYGVPWLVSLVWALLGLQTDGSRAFKAWPEVLVSLSLLSCSSTEVIGFYRHPLAHI